MPDFLPRVWQYKPFDKHDQTGCVFLQVLYGHKFCFRFVQPMVIAAQWKVHSDADLLHEVLRITHWCIHICAFFFSFSPTTARNGYKRMGYGGSGVLTNVQAKSFLVIYQDAVCFRKDKTASARTMAILSCSVPGALLLHNLVMFCVSEVVA